MLPQFKKDSDGGLTLLIQNESPGKEMEVQLATRTKRALRNVYAPLLAERGSLRRQLDRTEAQQGPVTISLAHQATKRTTMKTKTTLAAALLVGLAFTTARAADVTPAEARVIAKEAYIYGEPIVDNYRVQYAYFVDTKNPEYKAPWNHIWNSARLFSPADKAIQTANSDTLYSMIGADLRSEPIVLTIPKIEKERYFSVQLIDYYTQNFDYIGSRTTGNEGGTYLLAGPGWKGETPKGIDKVFRSETELAFPGYRTQLFNPGDLENVKKIQAGYKVQPLSTFLGPARTRSVASH